MNEQTTNDELAQIIKEGFDGVDLKFQAVNQRFDQVDSRLEKIERLILENHEQRLKRLEDALAIPSK